MRHEITYHVTPRVHDVRGDMGSHTVLITCMMSMAGRFTEKESCKEEKGMGFFLLSNWIVVVPVNALKTIKTGKC